MTKRTLQFRRGTTSENSTFVGALGEIIVDTTRKILVVHDGATAGGNAMAPLASPNFTGSATAITQTTGNNSTLLATTAFVRQELTNYTPTFPNTDSITEGSTKLFFTTTRARTSITVSGSLAYNSGTGVISYTQPVNISAFTNDVGYLTSASLRNQITVSGSLAYNAGTGVISYTQAVNSVNSLVGNVVLTTDNISEGTTNKYATSTTVRGYFSAGTGISITSGAVALTNTSILLNSKTISLTSGTAQTVTSDDITEGTTNKYATATSVRAQISAGTGITITNGQIALNSASTPSFAGLTVTGDVTIDSTTFKLDSTNNRVGINNLTPVYDLDVTGDVNLTGRIRANGSAGTAGQVLQSNGIISLATTGASGNAGIATITFATQGSYPFVVGQIITVSNVAPAGYNGTYTVTAVTTSSVSYANATTDTQTSTGTVIGAGTTWASISNVLPNITELDNLPIDGGTNEFYPYNSGNLVTLTAPVQALVIKNGVILTPYINYGNLTWLSNISYGDYTVDTVGRLVFSSVPQVGDIVNVRILVGNTVNTLNKTYPYRAIDILMGF